MALPNVTGLRVRNLLLDRRMLVEWFPVQLQDVATRSSFVAGTPSGTYNGSLITFDLPFTYDIGTNSLLVFSNGAFQRTPEDYIESNIDDITFVSARTAGDIIVVIKLGGTVEFSGYKILRATSPQGSFLEIGSVGPETTQFVDQVPATFGVAFFYKVVAFKGTEVGDASLISPVTDTSIDTFEDRPFLLSLRAEDLVTDEGIIGTQNGTNKLFTINNMFRPNTLVVRVNGLVQARNLVYTEIGFNQFQFVTAAPAPLSTDILRVAYVKL